MDELPDLPFEQILNYLSLEELLKGPSLVDGAPRSKASERILSAFRCFRVDSSWERFDGWRPTITVRT